MGWEAQAIAALTGAIAARQIAVLVGDVGAGKSTVLRATVAACSPARFPIAYLPGAPRDARDLYQSLLHAFGEQPPWSASDALHRLRQILTDLADAGRTPVVVLDEAQDLPAALLTPLRVLTLCRAYDYAERSGEGIGAERPGRPGARPNHKASRNARSLSGA